MAIIQAISFLETVTHLTEEERMEGEQRICPRCHEIVIPEDLTDPNTDDVHEFIYGVAKCPECELVDDWMSFTPRY